MKVTQINSYSLNNECGFALITAIMMLFAATILGLMVMNSSETEIILSGGQQRYERNFNTSDGGVGSEAVAVGTAATITRTVSGVDHTRTYAVVNPGNHNFVLSPSASHDPLFDPGSDTTAAGEAEYTVDMNTPSNQWPVENLLHSDAAKDNILDYRYRVVYLYGTVPPKGYDATKFSGYRFQIAAQRTSLIEIGASKVGPK